MKGFLKLREGLGPFGTKPLPLGRLECAGLREYLSFYGLWPGEDILYCGGVLESNGFLISAHLFVPPQGAEHIMIAHHGYLHHVTQFRNLMDILLDAGLAVLMYDMPGHGLSSGNLGDIENFSVYSDVLRDFVDHAGCQGYAKISLIGISLGGAVTFDYLRRYGGRKVEKVILAAPLVRCRDWMWTKVGMGLAGLLFKKVPRLKNTESSDKEFLVFNNEKDGLAIKSVPLNWVKAMHQWEKDITGADVSTWNGLDQEILLIQGDRDNVVDWRYNVEFLTERFRDVRLRVIDGARHELFNESDEYMRPIFDVILDFLNDPLAENE